MGSTVATVFIMLALLLMSAYFSATETAFLIMNRIRLKTLAENGNRRAAVALKVSKDLDQLISTILIGNNIVNITLSTVSTVFFMRLLPTSGATVSTIVMTLAVLIFGEITPKNLAKDTADSFVLFSAPFIRVIAVILAPLNYLFGLLKKLLSKILTIRKPERYTEQELITIVEEAEQDGGIDEQESELIRSAIEFNDRAVSDILTPRVDVIAVQEAADLDEIADAFTGSGFSRLPVYGETLDDIVGVIHYKDFFNQVLRDGQPLTSITKPPLFIPESVNTSDLLRLLQRSKAHMAFVADEYGGTVGLVTMEDILEELVGDIWDEHDQVVEEFVQRDEDTFQVLCSADLADLFDRFDVTVDPETDSSTVSGWVIERLGHIPVAGESFDYENLTISVLEADAKRVHTVSVHVAPKPVSDDVEE